MFSLSPWKLWAKSSSLLQASNNSRSHRDILELLYSCRTGWLRIEEQQNSGKRWEKLNWCCSDSNPPEVNKDSATRKGRWSRGWQEGQNRALWSNSRGWSGLESTRKCPAQGYLHFFLVRCVLNLPLKKQIKLRTSLSIKELWGKNPLKCENPPWFMLFKIYQPLISFQKI